MLKSPYFKRPLIITTIASLAFGSLTACNTMEGVGEDVKAAGDKIDESAEKHNNYENRSR